MTCPTCGAPSAPTKSPDDTPDWDAVVPLLNSSAELLTALKLLVSEAQALGWDCSHITPVIDKAERRSS